MDSDHQCALSETTNRSAQQASSRAGVSPESNDSPQMHSSISAGRVSPYFSPVSIALLISVLVIAGSYSILPIWLFLGRIWHNDPLRAIGAVFPVLALAGILAAWRRIAWSMEGTWWGLPVISASIVLGRITTSTIIVTRIHGFNGSLLHPGIAMFLYGVGAVLLFGGPCLLRAALAPLCLLLLVDPVPHAYNAAVDLPLQFLSANTARYFAHLIGLQPTGEQLRMMFAPNFGMQIVPWRIFAGLCVEPAASLCPGDLLPDWPQCPIDPAVWYRH